MGTFVSNAIVFVNFSINTISILLTWKVLAHRGMWKLFQEFRTRRAAVTRQTSPAAAPRVIKPRLTNYSVPLVAGARILRTASTPRRELSC